MTRFLIVTADDFGMHAAINEAVERARLAGALTATSLMVGELAAADAVQRARRLPGLRVGLHLTLADGRAVLPRTRIPDLVDSGGRFGVHMVRDGVRFFALRRVRRQLEDEIRAQFEAFAATGLELDHVNAHKHFHVHPTVLSITLRVGREFGLQSAGIRLPAQSNWSFSSADRMMKPWLFMMKQRLRRAGIRCNDQLFGMTHSGGMNEERLLAILARLPDGVSEIYLHPATLSGSAISPSMSAYRHDEELSALLSNSVRDELLSLRAAGVACGGYRDLP